MSLIPGSSSAPSIHPNGIASGSVATPLPLLIPYGITGQIGNVRASSSTAQTLVNADNDIQIFTPTAAHDVNLPTTDVASGRAFYIVNRGGYALTIKSSGGNTVITPSTGTVTNGVYLVRALQAAPTTAAHWQVEYVYETGTWVPSLGGTATYAAQSGAYIRNNNLVFIKFRMSVTLLNSGSTSSVSGLPYAASSNITASPGLSCGVFVSLAVSPVFITPYTTTGSANIAFAGLTAASGTTTNPLAIFGNGAIISVGGTYEC